MIAISTFPDLSVQLVWYLLLYRTAGVNTLLHFNAKIHNCAFKMCCEKGPCTELTILHYQYMCMCMGVLDCVTIH